MQSQAGKGTAFSVLLPAEKGLGDSGGKQAEALTQPEVANLRVLLVEDEPSVRRVAQRMLERSGYRVTEAENADQALVEWEREGGAFDILLTDLLMRARYFLETGRQPHDVIRLRGSAADRRNGSHSSQATEQALQGPGAPPNDVQDFRWPPARPTSPAVAETLGPFPAA